MEDKPTRLESVLCVYRDGELIAIVKRDEKSRKKIVYKVSEADVDDIVSLINLNHQTL